ncbi:MAG: hypothetical protein GX219_01430 [Tissierellia bacterium]|nr:hypothetical protein [Tissierellia bacterium]
MKYRILFKDEKPSEDLLIRIKEKHGKDIEGIEELYDDLIANKTCESLDASKIYYIAYSLSLENYELIIVRVLLY